MSQFTPYTDMTVIPQLKSLGVSTLGALLIADALEIKYNGHHPKKEFYIDLLKSIEGGFIKTNDIDAYHTSKLSITSGFAAYKNNSK